MRLSYLASGLALAIAMTAASAQAAVYHPSFAGPALDPSETFSGDPGTSYSVGAGTLSLFKAGGYTGVEGHIQSTFSTSGDFDAKLILDKSALGFVGLELSAYNLADGNVANVFSDGPFQFQSYVAGNFGAWANNTNNAVLELTRTGNLFQSFVNGTMISSGTFSPTAPLTFDFDICAGTCISTPDLSDRAAFITDFIVTTPTVPEPATWAMMLVGVGGLGGVMRMRKQQTVLA